MGPSKPWRQSLGTKPEWSMWAWVRTTASMSCAGWGRGFQLRRRFLAGPWKSPQSTSAWKCFQDIRYFDPVTQRPAPSTVIFIEPPPAILARPTHRRHQPVPVSVPAVRGRRPRLCSGEALPREEPPLTLFAHSPLPKRRIRAQTMSKMAPPVNAPLARERAFRRGCSGLKTPILRGGIARECPL